MNIEQQLASLLGDRAPATISEATALGTGLADGFDFYDSPVGKVVVAFNPVGISAVALAEEDYLTYFAHRFARPLIRAGAPRDWAHLIPERIEAGSPGRLPVDLRSVTAFQNQVLHEAADIPRGEVRPYGWLARQIGKPGAARAVGSTMARNPVPLIIPCHRVVRSDGHIGAYSLGGPHQKWQLLTHEGAEPDRLEDLASHNIRVQCDTSTGVYCFPACHVIRASQPGDVVAYASATEAAKAGNTPCSSCRPS